MHDAYLRLHLLSHRLVEPNRLNLEGIFSLLPNVAWTTLGPCECSRVPEARMEARKRGLTFEVTGGGGKERIKVGERCLIGANAGIGISLGDDCVVEAGCYVTAGARILLEDGRVVKARELSGRKGLLFRRNSQSGALEATRRRANWDGLNSQLHS